MSTAPATPTSNAPTAPPNIDDKRKEIEEKVKKAIETSGESPPAAPAPPDVPVPTKKMEISLGAADGAEMHLALMEFNLQRKEIDIAKLKLSEAKISLDLAASRAQERQQNFVNILKKLGVPEGWSFNRKEDGSYLFYPGPGPLPRGKK